MQALEKRDSDVGLPTRDYLTGKQHKELSRLRVRLAKRLRRHVRDIAARHVDRQLAEHCGSPEEARKRTDRSARLALISATCDDIGLHVIHAWLDEIERCFIRLRRQEPQWFLLPKNLDRAMLPVRTLDKDWLERSPFTHAYALTEGEARQALESFKAALPPGGPPFPKEALRYFEILGCFVSALDE